MFTHISHFTHKRNGHDFCTSFNILSHITAKMVVNGRFKKNQPPIKMLLFNWQWRMFAKRIPFKTRYTEKRGIPELIHFFQVGRPVSDCAGKHRADQVVLLNPAVKIIYKYFDVFQVPDVGFHVVLRLYLQIYRIGLTKMVISIICFFSILS